MAVADDSAFVGQLLDRYALDAWRMSVAAEDPGGGNMKRAFAAVVGGLLGMGAGVIVWTMLAVVALIIYWVGFVFLYCGVVCGRPGGKGFGLGWCDPPENLDQVMGAALVYTAISFTWGEIIAGLLGAVIGVATAFGLIRLFSFVPSVFRRNQAT